MTMTENPQRERTQPEQAARANQQHAAEQRQAAANVGTAVADARSERTRARHLGADTRRLEDAGKILDAQINGREDMSVLRPGNALRHNTGDSEHGTGNLAAVAEFVHRVFIMGELPFDVLEDMHAARGDQRLAPAEQHAQETYRQAYRLENAAVVQPALPAGPPAPQSSNGVPQQRREPIVPPAPEVPHVDEPREWSTMQAGQIALAGEARGVLKPETVQRLSDEGYGQKPKTAAPDMGPAAPAQFGASAVRIGDTQPMRLDEVLGHLAMDDAGVEAAGEPDSVVRPFSGTGLSGDASPARDSGVGDDDES